MNGMIRETKPTYQNKRMGAFFIVGFLEGLILLLLWLSWQQRVQLGELVFSVIAASCLCVMILLIVFGIMPLLRHWNGRFKASSELNMTALRHVFEAYPQACLLMRGDRAVLANAAYMRFVQQFNPITLASLLNRGETPNVVQLFAVPNKNLAEKFSQLYVRVNQRLRDLEPDVAENIRYLDDQGEALELQVQVRSLADMNLWVLNVRKASEQFFDQAPVGLISFKETGEICAINECLKQWLGYMPGRVQEMFENDMVPTFFRQQEHQSIRFESTLQTAGMGLIPVMISLIWENYEDMPALIAHAAIYGHSSQPGLQDITSSEQVYEDIVRLSPVAVMVLQGQDITGALITEVNPAFDRMIKEVNWKNQPFEALFDKDYFNPEHLQQAVSGGTAFETVLAGIKPTAVTIYFTVNPADATHCWAYMVDMSPRKIPEEQLLQFQKMQAIGQLAAGVAHDFNNFLTIIQLNVGELLSRHPLGDPSYQELQNINTTVNRAGATVHKLLAFSRKQTRRVEWLDITETLSDLSVNLKHSLGEQVRLHVVHGRDLPKVRADKGQLDTILLNLCVNARDAMMDGGGGDITIETAYAGKVQLLADDVIDVRGEDFVLIRISDTGMGMSETVKSKLFEPFFTTKEQGKGTGLGLATVYGIIQQSDGYVTVDSVLGEGTTFKIYLPSRFVSRQEAGGVAESSSLRKPAKPIDLTGQGQILLVEDEASVRTIAAKTLRQRGYTVVEAEDGEAAFEILKTSNQLFDLMISDVVMPGMDGPALLKKADAWLKDTQIIFISGYAEEKFSDLLTEKSNVTFLPKPFTIIELAEKVKSKFG